MKAHGRGNGFGVRHIYGFTDRKRRVWENEARRTEREDEEDARAEKQRQAHRIAMTRPHDFPGQPYEVLVGKAKDRRALDFTCPAPANTEGTYERRWQDRLERIGENTLGTLIPRPDHATDQPESIRAWTTRRRTTSTRRRTGARPTFTRRRPIRGDVGWWLSASWRLVHAQRT